MRKIIYISLITTLLVSCSRQQTNRVQEHVDSLIVKHQNELTQAQTELKNAQQQLPEATANIETLKGNFIFQKDEKRETEGFYYTKGATHNDARGTGLMAQVGEAGTLIVTSFHQGSAINHRTVMVSVPGESFTTVTGDLFVSTSRGRTEYAGFSSADSKTILDFIEANKDKQLDMELQGTSNIRITLPSKTIKSLLELSALHKAIEKKAKLEKDVENANLHIKFMERKLKEDDKLLNEINKKGKE